MSVVGGSTTVSSPNDPPLKSEFVPTVQKIESRNTFVLLSEKLVKMRAKHRESKEFCGIWDSNVAFQDAVGDKKHSWFHCAGARASLSRK